MLNFLNTAIFWGTLGLSLPVLIHLWHRKRGKPLLWAATQWLEKENMQSAKGLKFENLLLLILRLALLSIFIFILAQVYFKGKEGKTAHLILPQKEILDEFKFEINQALQNGEKIFWLNGEEVSNFDKIPIIDNLQSGINDIFRSHSDIQKSVIYLSNSPSWITGIPVYIPGDFEIRYTKTQPVSNPDYISLVNGKYLTLDSENQLIQSDKPEIGEELFKDPLKVLQSSEKSGINLALNAITSTYGLTFEIDTLRQKETNYDLVFLDKYSEIADHDPIVFINNLEERPIEYFSKHIYHLNPRNDFLDDLNLSEMILETWLQHIGLAQKNSILNKNQIENQFKKSGEISIQTASVPVQSTLLILFILILAFERILALKKNE